MSDQLSFELPEQPYDPDATGEIPAITGPLSPPGARRPATTALEAAQVALFELGPEPSDETPAVAAAPAPPERVPTDTAVADPAGSGLEHPPVGTEPEPDAEEVHSVPPRRRDSALLWVGSGATLGLIALIAFGGGLGSDSPSSPRTTATTAIRTPSTAPTTSAAGGSPTTSPAAQPLALTVAAQPNKRVYVEVRRSSAAGARLFAGTLTASTVKRFSSPSGTPLWLNVAWAPNLAVTINGRAVNAPGGTVAYEVTRRGLRALDAVRTPAG